MASAAAGREDKKVEKYSNLTDYYYFLPIGVKTYGAYGPQGIKVVKQIGKKHQQVYLRKKSTLDYRTSAIITRSWFETTLDYK